MTIQQVQQLIASTQAHVNQLSAAYSTVWNEWNNITNGNYPPGVNFLNRNMVLTQLKNELAKIKTSYDAACQTLAMYQAQLQSYYKSGVKWTGGATGK